MKDELDFILFAVKQAKEAEKFGFTRNTCCRNLKIALHHYWQHKTLGLHGQIEKQNIPRSKAARGKKTTECQVEYVIPQMMIVNMLMDMKKPCLSGLLPIMLSGAIARGLARMCRLCA